MWTPKMLLKPYAVLRFTQFIIPTQGPPSVRCRDSSLLP
jgi:hypothetical protein